MIGRYFKIFLPVILGLVLVVAGLTVSVGSTSANGDWEDWDDCEEWYEEECEEPSPSPSPSPEPSPSPTPPPVGGGPEVGGNISTPQCPIDRPQQVDQVWFFNIQANEVTVHWANKGDAHSYHIAYGPSQDNLPWGIVVGGKASQVTLQNLPSGSLWVTVTAKSSADCGGPTSPAVKVGPQVLGAVGSANSSLMAIAGLGSILLGLWQAQRGIKKGSKEA